MGGACALCSQFEDRPIGGGGTSGYVHPALLDSDSSGDEDDGPSLAEALREPGLIGMSLRDSEGALEGLLGRYADGAEQPLQVPPSPPPPSLPSSNY